MDSFRTELTLNKAAHPLALSDRFVSIGSCFSQFMAEQLSINKFRDSIEPFGTVYNPLSIHKLLGAAIDDRSPSAEGLVQRDDRWFHYDFHSKFTGPSGSALQLKLQELIANTHTSVQLATCVIITYGTAWVYTLRDSGAIVANCHKKPQALFYKRLLTPAEIVGSFKVLFDSYKRINPAIRFILSVSPVRHLKDSMELNSLSKSCLRMAVHEITTSFENVDYFPAFELLLDDLRDYRFYADDMIHPSAQAEAYVWQKFAGRYLDSATLTLLGKWQSVRTALLHRPFDPASISSRRFREETLRKLKELRSQMDVEAEITELIRQLEMS